jgi:signal transduction histidine kinase
MAVTGERPVESVVAEQAALRRIATLVAEGATEAELGAAVTSEIGRVFEAHRASTMRWEGDTIRIVGSWSIDGGEMDAVGLVFPFGGDTTTARMVETGAPARVDATADLRSDMARKLWKERGLESSIGAPIVVGGKIWGVVTAFRTRPGEPFPEGAEFQLHDFAALVAQSIVNADARRETAALMAEQSALRRIATLVAGGRPEAEVLEAVVAEVAPIFGAEAVTLVRWEGVLDEVVVVAAWSAAGTTRLAPGALYHPSPGGATLQVLETGLASRSEETSPERGACWVIAAPVIVQGSLSGALTAARPAGEMFPAGAEIRLRSFADLASQSMTNARAQAELRASRARLVQTADETRRRLERNLHDGAQQRLVSLSVTLRLAASTLKTSPEQVGELLAEASEELAQALEELRDLARGLHPAMLSERGLGPALEGLAARMPLPVEVAMELDARLPEPVEAAIYYVVTESLTNVVKYAAASKVVVRVASDGVTAVVTVADDGAGGARLDAGTGLRGLADRVEALGGTFTVESEAGAGTTVGAELPIV